ncbi:MAG TPA: hypothetical protein VES20_12465, partial [Bryobacteraceae bacterium]|nr:hypothetical protein [Bryobacteraceae bacterium]
KQLVALNDRAIFDQLVREHLYGLRQSSSRTLVRVATDVCSTGYSFRLAFTSTVVCRVSSST